MHCTVLPIPSQIWEKSLSNSNMPRNKVQWNWHPTLNLLPSPVLCCHSEHRPAKEPKISENVQKHEWTKMLLCECLESISWIFCGEDLFSHTIPKQKRSCSVHLTGAVGSTKHTNAMLADTILAPCPQHEEKEKHIQLYISWQKGVLWQEGWVQSENSSKQ